jgi:hypothetical protein
MILEVCKTLGSHLRQTAERLAGRLDMPPLSTAWQRWLRQVGDDSQTAYFVSKLFVAKLVAKFARA